MVLQFPLETIRNCRYWSLCTLVESRYWQRRANMLMGHMGWLHFGFFSLYLRENHLYLFGFNFSSAEQSKNMTVEQRNSSFLCFSNQPTWKSQRPRFAEITNTDNICILNIYFKLYIFQNVLVFPFALSRRLISVLDPHLYLSKLDQLPLFFFLFTNICWLLFMCQILA